MSLRFWIALLIAVPACAWAQEKPSQYSADEYRPSTGTAIVRKMIEGGRVPLNKQYHELSDQEKAVVNSYYEHIAPGDEPPFPQDGLMPIYDAWIKGRKKLPNMQGPMLLVASIDKKGEVTDVQIIETPSMTFAQYAASVLLLTKFKPAVCRGEPCKMDFPFYMNFTLRYL